MKAKGWMFTALVAGGAVVASRGCFGGSSSGDPDVRLAGQLDEMLCKIASKGIKDPVAGVKKFGSYLADHTGDVLKNFGDTFALIESIPDDVKHDKRAEKARDTLYGPLIRCADTYNKFVDAVEGNEEAARLVARADERLGRTFEIIFGQNRATRTTLRDLPSELARLVSTKLR